MNLQEKTQRMARDGLTVRKNTAEGNVHGRLNASWKISCLAVNGQSFLVIDGYLVIQKEMSTA